MFTKIAAGLIAAVLVFGGAAATATAARSSLPLDALYPIKMLGEQFELGLTTGSQIKLEKALEHLQRRVVEMAALGEMGEQIPAHLSKGYVEQVEYALRLASKMSDEETALALSRIQASLQEQLWTVEQLQLTHPDDAQLTIVAGQLRQYLGLVALGLNNPGMFAENLAALLQGAAGPSITQEPSVTETPVVTETPPPGDDNSNDDNANGNGDDSNSNDDNANGDDDSNSNGDDDDDDSNSNGGDDDDDSNSNGDDDDDDSNSNGDDDDDDSNSNGDDDDDDSNSNGDDDSNSNGDDDDDDSNSNGDDDDSAGVTSGNLGNSSILTGLYNFLAWVGSGFLFA
jgi:hypothetical protein